ncbi:hypothetical protein NXY00_05520 [Bacteroides sp. BFG-551]|nr:hypothetical protein [Bacteroides sp. BFG-551]
MKKKESDNIEKKQCPTHVAEPVSEYGAYARRRDNAEVSLMITQETLDEECIALSESKNRILEKVHNHFRK